MGKKKKKDRGYQAAVKGARGVIRMLIYVVIILLIVLAGKTAYSFGYLVFDQRPATVTREEGEDVTVVVKEGDSVYDVGETLVSKGLADSPLVFWVQEKLSEYEGMIRPGTYLLNTEDNVEEMLAILSGEDTEGQPSQDTGDQAEDGSGESEGENSDASGEETAEQEDSQE